jgi:hypothetical protein
MYMSDIQSLIGHGSSEAERKKAYRERIKYEGKAKKQVGHCPGHRPPELELELELEKEIKKKIKVRNKMKVEDIKCFETLFKYWEENKSGGKYKNEVSRNGMLNKLINLTNNDLQYAYDAIMHCIANNYKGFTDGSKLYYTKPINDNTVPFRQVE